MKVFLGHHLSQLLPRRLHASRVTAIDRQTKHRSDDPTPRVTSSMDILNSCGLHFPAWTVNISLVPPDVEGSCPRLPLPSSGFRQVPQLDLQDRVQLGVAYVSKTSPDSNKRSIQRYVNGWTKWLAPTAAACLAFSLLLVSRASVAFGTCHSLCM